jgi:hypothetical protein
MVLVSCSECTKEISNKAPACPHCGCPIAAQESTVPEKEERESGDALAAELVNKVNAGGLSKIDAIIAYKDETRVGFNEAKKSIEELLPLDAAKPTGKEAAIGCSVTVILLIVIISLFKFGCTISQDSNSAEITNGANDDRLGEEIRKIKYFSNTVGLWLNGKESIIVMSKEAGDYYVVREIMVGGAFPSGSVITSFAKKSGDKYLLIESSFGEYYRLDSDIDSYNYNTLSMFDSQGVIYRALPTNLKALQKLFL